MKTLSLAKIFLATGFILGLMPGLTSAQTNCFDCHETTGCQTPAKPEGTCASCHLGTGDTDDYSMNFTEAILDTSEWLTAGHGQPGIAMDCEYCHDYDVRHGEQTNPFRLRNVSATGPLGQNSNCWACHATDSLGVDPDSVETTFSLINSVVKMNSYHAGLKHDELEDGGTFCWDCHDPHGDSNIKMIHKDVTYRSDGQYGIPVETKWVEFTDNLLPSDFVHNVAPGPYNGVCQVCHTNTDHCQAPCFGGHDSGPSCTLCHSHDGDMLNDGWKPSCNACHGYPPVVNTPQGVDGLVGIPEPTGALSAGAHQVHADDYGISCYTCHYDGMPSTPVDDDYRIQMGFDILGFDGIDSVYNGQNLSSAYSYHGTNGTTITNGTPTTCSNIYCHSNGTAVSTSFADPTTYPGPNQSSPAWDGSTACNSCHNYGPAYQADHPKANQHQRHLDLFNNPLINYDEHPCHFCHYNTTTDGSTISNRANHVNRQYDVAANTGSTYFQNTSTPIPVNFTYTYSPGGGTCSNITCHQGLIDQTESWGGYISGSYSWSPGSACGEVSILFSVTSSNAIPPYQYKIDWESDGTWDYEGLDNNHTHLYTDVNTQYITYSAMDATGKTFSGDGTNTTGPITPSTQNALPVVSVSASTEGYTVTLTDQSFDPDYNTCGHSGSGRALIDWGPGGYVSYNFDPPLSDSPSGQQFSYTYTSSGTKSIRYGVYDNVITYPVFNNFSVTVPQN